mgnify:CR=1 FL=1
MINTDEVFMELVKKEIGVIISTYNNPLWLEKTLWGYLYQTKPADEILIADDGSDERTRLLIEKFKEKLPIKHIWHSDQGFRKTKILNLAIVEAKSDYLIFTDQDCIPRKDFIATHVHYAARGFFLSGGYYKLPMSISMELSHADVKCGQAFSLKWLRRHHLRIGLKCLKLINNYRFSFIMNMITPAKATWNGCNSSGWKCDILAVNGFNEEMQYGGEDREFGERLFNYGVKSKQIRYSAIVLHLDHARPYKTKEVMKKNDSIRKNTREKRTIRTNYGIEKHFFLIVS